MNKDTVIILAVVGVGAIVAYMLYQKSKQTGGVVATNGNQNARNVADPQTDLGQQIQGGLSQTGDIAKAARGVIDDIAGFAGGF